MASAQASTSFSICTLVTARRIGMLPSSGTSQAKPGSAAASRHPIIASFMQGKLTPAAGIVILMVAATSFAANHVSARVAFDHGASVAAGVLTRATGTALVLLLLMKVQGVVIAVPRALMPRLAGAGVLVAVQSYCLYSAVALIPAALALLVFQTSAMLYLLLSWALGKEKPHAAALADRKSTRLNSSQSNLVCRLLLEKK